MKYAILTGFSVGAYIANPGQTTFAVIPFSMLMGLIADRLTERDNGRR